MDEVSTPVQVPPYYAGSVHLGGRSEMMSGEGRWVEMTLERASYDPLADMLTATVILSHSDWEEESILPYREPVGDVYFGFLSSGWGFDAIDPLGTEIPSSALRAAVSGYRNSLMLLDVLPSLLEGESA